MGPPATDWNIVAGTSNWGGYALAAVAYLSLTRWKLSDPDFILTIAWLLAAGIVCYDVGAFFYFAADSA